MWSDEITSHEEERRIINNLCYGSGPSCNRLSAVVNSYDRKDTDVRETRQYQMQSVLVYSAEEAPSADAPLVGVIEMLCI